AGMAIDTDAKIRGVRRVGEDVEVTFEEPAGEARVETFAWALIAAGRRPNLGNLALDRAGGTLDARGVPKFDRATLRCEGAPVFIAGDANHDHPLLHEASDEGRIAGDNAARFPDEAPAPRRSLLAITFSDPQIAVAGAPYASLDD